MMLIITIMSNTLLKSRTCSGIATSSMPNSKCTAASTAYGALNCWVLRAVHGGALDGMHVANSVICNAWVHDTRDTRTAGGKQWPCCGTGGHGGGRQ